MSNTNPIEKVRFDFTLTLGNHCCRTAELHLIPSFIHRFLWFSMWRFRRFPADVKRVWGFEGLRGSNAVTSGGFYANRRGLFVTLCLVRRLRWRSSRRFRSRVCDIETRALPHRLDKPHGLDARSERDRRTLGTQLWFWDTFSPWESFSFDYKSTHLLTLAERSYVQH